MFSLLSDQTKIKYKSEYISYLNNGESAAVFVARDIASTIKTDNKWIDIIDYYKEKNNKNRYTLDYIIIELFNKIKTPKYPQKEKYSDDEYRGRCKYITWETAHEDIEEQRKKGISGPIYLLLCKLENKSIGKVVWEDALWNNAFNQWVPAEWKTSSCVVKKRKRYIEPEKDDWQYDIIDVKSLNQNELDYIEKHRDIIESKIKNNGQPKLEFFYK